MLKTKNNATFILQKLKVERESKIAILYEK